MLTTQISRHFLLPSTLFASADEYVIDTILGSCVAVCLFDQRLKIGGINHYMLPLWNGDGLSTPKYGNVANEVLFERMLALGSQQKDLIAKVFGGANQMGAAINVGERNVVIAIEQMQRYKIPVKAESLGGQIGRKIRFNNRTGEVLMKFLSSSNEKD
jgi:chemotaxis protein CheD